MTLNDLGDWSAGVQYRMFGPRPLTDDNTVRSPATSIVNVRIGYKVTEAITARLDIDNLLDAQGPGHFLLLRLAPEKTNPSIWSGPE